MGRREGQADRDIALTLDELARRTHEVYLHVDFDAFAPELAPGTADEPVPGGLTLEQAQTIIAGTAERILIRAATFATYAPDRDREERTLRLALTLIGCSPTTPEGGTRVTGSRSREVSSHGSPPLGPRTRCPEGASPLCPASTAA